MARPAKPKLPPFSLPVCLTLWLTIWAPALRAAGAADPLDTSALAEPRWPVLRVLGPLWLLRQAAQAVATRLACGGDIVWSVFARYRQVFAVQWDALANEGIEIETRLAMDEEELPWFMGLQLAFCLRLLDDSCPLTVEGRLRGIAGCCWRLALLYREACRRWGWRQARVVVLEELRCFLGQMAQTG